MSIEQSLENFEILARPISEDHPSGVDPRLSDSFTSPFRQLQMAFDTAKAAEKKQADWFALSDGERQQQREWGADEVQPPDWQSVKSAAVRLLSEHAKDLWAVSWLLESLIRIDGFVGLRDGFRLVSALCEQEAIWATIHPRPADGETIQYTLARLNGLGDGGLTQELLKLPITNDSNSIGEFTGIDYNDAADLDRTMDENSRKRKLEAGIVPLETIQKAARESGADFYRNLLRTLDETLDAFHHMNRVLGELCGANAPASTNTRKALEEVRQRVVALAKDLLATEELSPESMDNLHENPLVANATNPGSVAQLATSQVQNRDQAFRALLQVADFFRQTEPQSPVSDALQQAVRWGRMSFRELMQELVEDEASRKDLFRRTGTAADGDDKN